MHRGFQCEYGLHNAVRITVYIDSPVGCTSGRTIVGCTRTLEWDWQHFIEIAGDFCGKRIAMDVRSYRSSSCWSRDPSGSGYPCWPGSFPSICRILRFPGTSAESINAIEPGRRMWARLLLQLVPCWDEK